MIAWYYFALLSSLMLGTYSILEKVALRKEYATAFSSAFSYVAAIMVLPFLFFAKFDFGIVNYALILIDSGVIALTYLLAARVYRHGEISVAAGAFSSLPSLFVVMLAIPILGESLTLLQYICIVVMALVIYAMLSDRNGRKRGGKSYNATIVVRSILVAAQALLTKYILASVGVYSFLVLSELFVALYFAAYITLRYNGMEEITRTVRDHAPAVFSMAALTIGYGLTYYLSLMSAEVSLVTPLRNTVYVVITVVIGGLLFKEEELKRKLVLCAVLLLFAYLLVV